MKKNLFLIIALLSLSATAQTKFGYVSFHEVLTAMPEYAAAQADLEDLQKKCEKELTQSEKDFNKKYAEYIDGQETFPALIRDKRQKELQELLEKSIEFKKDVQKTMAQARCDMMQPLRERIAEAARKLCVDEGYEYIIDSDKELYIAINETTGTDVTAQLKAALGIPSEPAE